MSKHRFKKREEFIRDGLWDDKYNCPNKWSSDGDMNKYLGKDVPDDFNVYCDKNESFEHDDWLFQNTDYVLKEQQEYFPDLSQHIGRYIRALVDNPHLGNEVKKGDVGKIITRCQVDFPNRKSYSCRCALSKDYLGVKYELLPEDYSPEKKFKEPSVEFIPGKWYKYNRWYIKYKEHIDGVWRSSEEIDSCKNYRQQESKFGDRDSDDKKILLTDLSEIQEYLPKGHPDKVIKQDFKVGKWYKWYQKNHENYHYGKVKRIDIETDTLVMSPWIIQRDDYNHSGTFNLSKAEQIQEISVEQIQEFLPNSHPDKITSDVFKKGEYIVITDNYSGGFCTNYVYKQRKDHIYLEAELDNKGSRTNGFSRYEKNDSHNWRYATQEEINEYERRGKPYDVTELQKKELSMKEIQEECKKRFPIGCTYLTPGESTCVLKDNSYTYHINGQTISAHSGGGLLYADGKYATLVFLPEENITEIPEYVVCVNYFDSKYTGKIYNTTIDKPEKNSTNTWYEILIDRGRLKDGSFKISNKEAYEKQKSHIPEYIECTETRGYYFIKGNIYKVIDSNNLSSAKLVSNIDFSGLKAGMSLICSMGINGKKYWKPSTKEKYDQQKPLTYESVSGCFPTDKTMFIYDEVGQFPSILSDYWKNVPTFVEKEFDIYGPTPDIE